MALRLGDTAPDFTADTNQGRIGFHEWLGDSWAILFSHPRDFTPVCTTELGYVARLKPEFDQRGVKAIGLSIDPVDEILRVIDSLQLTDAHRVATPVNWKQGDDVIIVPAVTDAEAKEKFPTGWRSLTPYLN